MGAAHKGDELSSPGSFFELSARTVKGSVLDFSRIREHSCLFLVVNTACRAPSAQQKFAELAQLHQLFERRGLEILAFPTNAFCHELPTDQEIDVCLEANYRLRFLVFEKAEVNGPAPHPVWAFLRRHGPLYRKGICGQVPADFTRFLVDGEGRVVLMAPPSIRTVELQAWINQLLPPQ